MTKLIQTVALYHAETLNPGEAVMKRTMYSNSAVRIVYRSYSPEPILTLVPTFSRWTIISLEITAMFITGAVVAVLL